MRVWVGTSGFSYPPWRGSFYPAKLPAADMLAFYAQQLPTVEINNTFYRMPSPTLLERWSAATPVDFVFALKAPQIITHMKQLRNAGNETEYLFSSLSVLGAKLGPVLFQLPRSFHADRTALESFLALIPGNMSCAFEFRSTSWLAVEILDLLRGRKFSLCISDTDENPAGDIISTAPWGYLRLRHTDYTDDDLSKWKSRILAQKWERAFVFFKHEDEAKGAEMAMRFYELVK